MSPKSIRQGFTLIELLVVVAIIALLISILLPSLAAARERSRSAVCQSNLRAMTVAYRIYADEDNDVVMPPTGMGGVDGFKYWNFYMSNSLLPDVHLDSSLGLLSPYLGKIDGPTRTTASAIQVGTLKATICPTRPLGTLLSWVNTGPLSGFPFIGPGTGYAPRASNANVGMALKMSAFTQQSETICFADTEGLGTNNQEMQTTVLTSQVQAPFSLPSLPGMAGTSQPAMALGAVFHGRHNGVGNVAWVDGHVSSEQPYINPSMTSYASYSKLKIGYLIPLAQTTSWTDFVNSYNKSGPANANFYVWSNKEASY